MESDINVSQTSDRNSKDMRVWDRLVEPAQVLQDTEIRQQARLVTGLIFVLFVLLSAGMVATVLWYKSLNRACVFVVACIFMLTSYGLSRTRYFSTAGILALFTLSSLPVGEVIVFRNYEDLAVTLMWLILPLILATVMLKLRDQVLLALVDILGLVILANFTPQSAFRVFLLIGALILSTSGILIVREIYRRHLENNRQAELIKSNQELETIRTSLEDKIAERTRNAEEAKIEAEQANRALEMQMWQVSGLAELASVMRGVQTTGDLAASIIKQVCRYAEVPVGALFVAERDELYLAGSYAYPFPTNPNPRFRFGSGLVGEAAQDQQVITLRDIPEHYLPITSGLGEVVPAQIVAVPCTYQDHTIGVMELASLQPFSPMQIQFLMSVMEPIASALDTALIRARIDELLIETQQQAEELQSQEEEQRKGNIELDQREAALRQQEQQLQEQKINLETRIAEMVDNNAASQDIGEAPDDD